MITSRPNCARIMVFSLRVQQSSVNFFYFTGTPRISEYYFCYFQGHRTDQMCFNVFLVKCSWKQRNIPKNWNRNLFTMRLNVIGLLALKTINRSLEYFENFLSAIEYFENSHPWLIILRILFSPWVFLRVPLSISWSSLEYFEKKIHKIITVFTRLCR